MTTKTGVFLSVFVQLAQAVKLMLRRAETTPPTIFIYEAIFKEEALHKMIFLTDLNNADFSHSYILFKLDPFTLRLTQHLLRIWSLKPFW